MDVTHDRWAVRATRSPPALQLLWSSRIGGGPPIVAAGLVWTIGQNNGMLYGLDPATGRIRQQVAMGRPANHFPTPSVGDGLLLAAGAQNVVTFAAPALGAASAPTAAGTAEHSKCLPYSPPIHLRRRYIAAIAFGAVVVIAAIGWLLWRRIRH